MNEQEPESPKKESAESLQNTARVERLKAHLEGADPEGYLPQAAADDRSIVVKIQEFLGKLFSKK